MCDDDKLVRMLSLRERREAVEAELEWLDQKEAIMQHVYEQQKAQLRREREAALQEMRVILREEIKGRAT
jgi:hypothetical protein